MINISDIDLEYSICFFETSQLTHNNEQDIINSRTRLIDILSEFPATDFLYINLKTKKKYSYQEFVQMAGIASALEDKMVEEKPIYK